MTQKIGTRAWSVPVRFRYLFLLATICGSSFLLISVTNTKDMLFFSRGQSLSFLESHHYEIVNDETTYTIKTEGCTIPSLRPLDEDIKKFIQPPTGMKQCPNANYSLVQYNETHLWIDTEIAQYYSLNDGNISCCYKSFYRPSAVKDVFSKTVDDRVQYENCVEFSDSIEIAHEFVSVSCHCQGQVVYEQYFIFAREKPMKRSEDSPHEQQNLTNSYYNVIVMGIDAVSRQNFYRTMPKTLAYLKRKGAIELLGYNKVGDNTFPNLTPMLLGISDVDLKKTCWHNRIDNFDNCPFIWQWYKDAGFYTAFGEDSASLGNFNYQRYGFIKTPTDYYIHTFIHEAEKKVGKIKDFNSFLCMGNKYFYRVLLDYIADLTSILKHSRLFGFFWEVTMSHDHLNYPMVMDDSYERFLKTLDDNDYLNNSVIVLLSDHGIRWGGIRLTKQGRLEERLPFAYILLPETFAENFNSAFEHIKQNSRRLTTPYDIHATLTDLINLDTISDEKIAARLTTSYGLGRSISLFLPVPQNRTCAAAGIADHWCTCSTGIKMHVQSFEAREAANQLVDHLNQLLVEHKQCARLQLAETLEVTEMLVGQARDGEKGWQEFMTVVRTSPGGGLFEGTLRHADNRWVLTGTVSRLNLYGDQSHCVHHYQLKLYCYCL